MTTTPSAGGNALLYILLAMPASAALLAGMVQDPDGAPVVGAEVLAINSQLQAASAETDAQGHYRFQGLPEGVYRILARPRADQNLVPRYHPSTADLCDGTRVSTGPQSVQTNIVVPPGHIVTGRVVDVGGEPVGAARIQARSLSGHHNREAATDSDGGFVLMGLEPQGEWTLSTLVSGHPMQWFGNTYSDDEAQALLTPDDTDIGDWTLLEGIGVSGTVRGPLGPVADALVRVYSSGQVTQAMTDSDGHYDAVGIPPGEVTAWATAAGYGTTYLPDYDRPTTSVEVTTEGSWQDGLDIEMPTEVVLSVQLAGDAPRTNGDLSGLPVVLYNDTQSIGRAAQTTTDGLAVFRGLHEGLYTLYIYGGDAGHGDDWARDDLGQILSFNLDGEEPADPVPVQLAPAVTIEGTIVDDYGVPIPGATVVIREAIQSEEDLATFFLTGTTDESGSFEIVGVPDGEWSLSAVTQSVCSDDPGHVPVYWPGTVDPLIAEPLNTKASEPIHEIRLTMPRDSDHDAMGDRWERRYSLDTSRDDSTEDPDLDGLTNLMEYRLRTDPRVPEGEWVVEGGCRGCTMTAARRPSASWLLVLLAPLWARRRADGASRRRRAHLVR